MLKHLISTTAPASVLLIRLMVGAVFLFIVGAGKWSVDARWTAGDRGTT